MTIDSFDFTLIIPTNCFFDNPTKSSTEIKTILTKNNQREGACL